MTLPKNEEGGMVLEAALILPMFVSFVIALIVCIQISIADMALRSAVGESTKVLAANMYPAETLYQQASQSGVPLLDHIKTIRDRAAQADEFIESVEAFIPDPVAGLIDWVRQIGSKAEGQVDMAADSVLKDAMKPVVYSFADPEILKKDRFHVTGVTLPSFDSQDQVFIGFEVEYEFPLAVPFFSRTLTLKKRALERVWLGA
ncbi:hypothetical protein [Paenibacillus sp. FJAT-26967]|uniref:hypothetical protein n=1 Tax=Paenibacillus sp. FJAT-26967 TaxID=1729690 RepID=UPI000A4EB371|nr:hypothetical protein [Paenibacillus sp. FJAT-26967]